MVKLMFLYVALRFLGTNLFIDVLQMDNILIDYIQSRFQDVNTLLNYIVAVEHRIIANK